MTTVPTLVPQGMNEHGGCIICGVIPEMVVAKIDALEAENARLREALTEISNPVATWQSRLKEGERLNGAMCVQMLDSPVTYREIARKALETT